MSELDKELQEFDIDLDKDDVSDVDDGRTTGALRKSAEEDEVKTEKARSQRPNHNIYLARQLTNTQHDLLSSSSSDSRASISSLSLSSRIFNSMTTMSTNFSKIPEHNAVRCSRIQSPVEFHA